MVGNCQKAVAFVETAGRIVFGVDEKTDDTRLFGDQGSAVNGL